MEKKESKVHFSRKSRNIDGRKNIDDVWWVNGIGHRHKELENIDAEIARNNGSLAATDKRIKNIDKKIAKRKDNINTIKTCLKGGAVISGVTLIISFLGAGISTGFQIWCGLMALPTVVGISAVKVQNDYKKEIEALEEDKCIEEIDRGSYQRTIEELHYKKKAVKGERVVSERSTSHDILERPQCIYYQYTPQGDTNNYSDEVFQVGGTEPYNWTAHKLINRIAHPSQETSSPKTKAR